MRWLLLFLWLLALPSWAQITMWNATPLEPGTFELDYFLFSSTAHRTFDEQGLTGDLDDRVYSNVNYAGFGWGIAPNVDLWVYSSHTPAQDDEVTELGSRRGGSQTDLAVQARWRFLHDEDDGLSLAFIGGPLYQNPLLPDGQSFISLSGELVLEKQLSDELTLVADSYFDFPLERNENTYHQFGADLCLSWMATEWLNPVLEVNYFQSVPSFDGLSDTWATTLGTVIYPCDEIALYLGYQFNIAGRNEEQFGSLITGLTASF